MSAAAGRRAFLTEAYEQAWADFLKNRTNLAEKRARSALQLLAQIAPAEKDAEQLIEEADLCYIVGAASGQESVLQQALLVYEKHLKLVPSNSNARRMMAETLLRLHRYEDAFTAFFDVSVASQQAEAALQTAEVAPFRLIHDAEQLEHLITAGKIGDEFMQQAELLRQLAAEITRGAHSTIFNDSVSEKLARLSVKQLPIHLGRANRSVGRSYPPS